MISERDYKAALATNKLAQAINGSQIIPNRRAVAEIQNFLRAKVIQ